MRLYENFPAELPTWKLGEKLKNSGKMKRELSMREGANSWLESNTAN